MVTISPVNRRFWRIIFNYNLPVLLWAGAALAQAQGIALFDHCFIKQMLGICFGCGLTHDLVSLMSGNASSGYLIYLIIAGFMLNLIHSVRYAGTLTGVRFRHASEGA